MSDKEELNGLIKAIAKEFELPCFWKWMLRCLCASVAISSLALAVKLVLWCLQ